MNRILVAVLKNHRAVLVVIAVLTAALLYPLSRLRTDNSIGVWLDQGGREYVTYKNFVKEFNVQDFMIAAVEGLDASDRDTGRLFNTIAVELRKIEGVRTVYHFNDVPFFLPGAKERLSGLLISKDKKVYSFWISTGEESKGKTKDIIEKISLVLSLRLPKKAEYHLAGPPVLNNALDQSSVSESWIFFPAVLVLSGLALFMLFKDLKVLLVCFTVAAVTQIWSLSLVSITGNSMNMVMTALPPLLWVLSFSALIYMVNSMKTEQDIVKAVMKVIRPCSLTVLTTAFGFLSLVLSHVGPVREMGVFTFTGLFISLFLSFTLGPVLLSKINIKNAETAGPPFFVTSSGYTAFLSRHKAFVFVCSALIVSAAIFYSMRINMDTNNLNFFKTDSKVYRDYTFVGERLTGHSPLEVVFELPEGMLFEKTVDMYTALTKELVLLDGVKKVVTPSTFYGLMNSASDNYVNENSSAIRLSVLTDRISTNATGDLTDKIRQTVDRILTGQYSSIKYSITGVVQLLVHMQDELLKTQVNSFSMAFLFIAVIFCLLFKDVVLAVTAVIPNIFPIVVNLGLMGLFAVPLNVATIMIASVAIGITDDDTIHFIVHYREHYQKSPDVRKSVEATLSGVGRPMVYTTLVNATGFGVLMFSDFMPIKYFGALMVATLVTALLADLILLPTLLLGGSRWMRG